jgi:hypothetical protein
MKSENLFRGKVTFLLGTKTVVALAAAGIRTFQDLLDYHRAHLSIDMREDDGQTYMGNGKWKRSLDGLEAKGISRGDISALQSTYIENLYKGGLSDYNRFPGDINMPMGATKGKGAWKEMKHTAALRHEDRRMHDRAYFREFLSEPRWGLSPKAFPALSSADIDTLAELVFFDESRSVLAERIGWQSAFEELAEYGATKADVRILGRLAALLSSYSIDDIRSGGESMKATAGWKDRPDIEKTDRFFFEQHVKHSHISAAGREALRAANIYTFDDLNELADAHDLVDKGLPYEDIAEVRSMFAIWKRVGGPKRWYGPANLSWNDYLDMAREYF